MLSPQAVDLKAERLAVYVPKTMPPAGYGLIVYISPLSEAKVPTGWGPVLDRFGLIFVSPANAGNDADVFGRREPLALLAGANVLQRARLDPERIYVAGF